MRAKWIATLLTAAAAAPLTSCLTVAFDSTGPGKLNSSQIKPGRSCTVYYNPVSTDDPGRTEGILVREENGWLVLKDAEGAEKWIRETQTRRVDYK